MSDIINIKLDGVVRQVSRPVYVEAKTKQLVDFGYGSLTSKEVDEQLTALLEGKELTVIGMFMEDEVLKQ